MVQVYVKFSDYVDVDLSDILTEDLVAELAKRDAKHIGVFNAGDGIYHDALAALKRGDAEYAELLLERALFPKFRTEADCMKAMALSASPTPIERAL